MNGYVLGASDTQPVRGATVELRGDPGDERLKSVHLAAVTDDRGKYALPEVPYGMYTFRVTAPGLEAYQIPLYVASDMLTQLHVRLSKVSSQAPN